ncbi:hypothetical protein [Bauldia sp.]|uniref:hypothetical protein n=1 Tax=Bauldia sp. TaxID=2575872 RepID=UPI003BAA5599
MNIWVHSAIAGISLVAMAAVAAASVAVYESSTVTAAAKSDRLPIAETITPPEFTTIEVRTEGLSVLNRIAVPETASN